MSAGTRYRQAQLASALQDHAKKHSDRWVKSQKEMLEKWREIVEERSKDDDRLFKDWSRSWMSTSFKMLEIQREAMAQAFDAQLEAIDHYLDHLDEHGDQGSRPGSGRTSARKTGKSDK